MTENNNYQTPEKGATDWHNPINKNFEKIDTDIEIRDVEANLGDYTPKDGAKFLATDTKRVYLGDGESWTHFTTLGGLPGQLYIQDAEPDGSKGDIWFDTS
jgi:hypothetical protein